MWVERNDPRNWVGEQHYCEYRGLDCEIGIPLSAESSGRYCTHFMVANHQWSRRWSGHVPRRVRKSKYWAPERSYVRGGLRQAINAHRAGGDVEDTSTALTNQHRRSIFGGGWWD